MILGDHNIVHLTTVPQQPRSSHAAESTLDQYASLILFHAARQGNGVILFHSATGGYRVIAGAKILFSGSDGRELARWKGGLDQVLRLGFAESRGPGKECVLTRPGFDYADWLATDDPVFSLSNEAIRILREAAKSSTGHIHLVPCDGGFVIKAGDHDFDFLDNPELAATWKAGFDQLLHRGFIVIAQHESVYCVSEAGFEALKVIDH